MINQSSMKKQLNNLVDNLALMQLKSDEVTEFKSKIDGLKVRISELDAMLQNLDREIQTIENQQIDKRQLRRVYQDFGGIYAGAIPEVKRRLLNVVIEQIQCNVKRGENKGEITFKLRGDGSIKKDWSEASKTKEDSSTPSSGGLSPHVAWLREQDSNLQPCGYGRSTAFTAVRTISSSFNVTKDAGR